MRVLCVIRSIPVDNIGIDGFNGTGTQLAVVAVLFGVFFGACCRHPASLGTGLIETDAKDEETKTVWLELRLILARDLPCLNELLIVYAQTERLWLVLIIVIDGAKLRRVRVGQAQRQRGCHGLAITHAAN